LIPSYKEILAAHGMESLHVQKFVQQSMGGVVVALQDFILFDWREKREEKKMKVKKVIPKLSGFS
jgi:hypothetical protein